MEWSVKSKSEKETSVVTIEGCEQWGVGKIRFHKENMDSALYILLCKHTLFCRQ